MFNTNYTLIKKTKLLLRLTSITNNNEIISASLPCGIKHLNKVPTKNNKFSSNPKSRCQKNTIVRIVKNPTIDWHCTKPLGKNELGLWFSFITQPFSTRKHWSILLPAQNLVFRLHWERSQSTDFVSSKLSNVTSLNWFSEKPVYFYVVMPFLGCLGLISGSVPNALKSFIPEKGEPGRLSFPIYRLSPFTSWHKIERNKELVHHDTLFQEWGASTSLNYVQDSYIATYSDSRSYFNYLNSSNLFKNLPLDLGSDSQTLCSSTMANRGQVLDFFTKGALAFRNTNFLSNEKAPIQFTEKKVSSVWEKYLYEKSKINWFWSNWALQDFSVLKENKSRFIWEKLTGSSAYKIIFDKKSHANAVFENSLFLNKTSTSMHSLFAKEDFELDEFAQKLFSIHLQFPKKILGVIPVEKRAEKHSTRKRVALFWGRPGNFSKRNLSQMKGFKSQLTKSNFILINGLKKKSADSNKLFRSFLASDRPSKHGFKEFYQVFGLVDFNESSTLFSTFIDSPLAKRKAFKFPHKDREKNEVVKKTSSQKKDEVLFLPRKEATLSLLYEGHRFLFEVFFGISQRGKLVPSFFLDNFFVQFYIDKRLNFLKSYFTPNSGTIFKNLSSLDKTTHPVMLDHTKFKKLNFPILLSGYANSDQIQCASKFKIFEPIPSLHINVALNSGKRTLVLSRNCEQLRGKEDTKYRAGGSLSLARLEKKSLSEKTGLREVFLELDTIPRSLCFSFRDKKEQYSLLSSQSFPSLIFTKNFSTHTQSSDSVSDFVANRENKVKRGLEKARTKAGPRDKSSSDFKWRSVGNWSFYWNYFKHFYGASSLFKPWSSTFDSLIVQKPLKNGISHLLFRNCFSPFKSMNVFPDENFLFNKWHSKKKQGFFYKRITKLEVKKRTSQASYSRVVSLLWGFRAKYKLDEVLQYQKSKYYQSKKAQQTAHQNFTQNSTTTNINNQMVMKTLTKRRRYKKYIEFNVLSSWLRDVLYFKKIGRKLIKIKNGEKGQSPFSISTNFFNHARTGEKRFTSQKQLKNRNFDQISFPVQTSLFIKKGPKGKGGLRPFFFASSARDLGSERFRAKKRRFSISPRSLGSTNLKRDSEGRIENFGKRGVFETDFLKSPSLNTSNTLFITLKNFSRLNKSHLLNSSLRSVKTRKCMIPNFGWDSSTSNSFVVNKTPVFLKKLSLASSNKRFLQLGSRLSNYRSMQFQFVSKSFKNFNTFWTKIVPICLTNFQTNISNKLHLQPAMSNSVKEQSNRLFFPRSFILRNKQKFLYYKFTKQNFLRFNRMFILQDSNQPYLSRTILSPGFSGSLSTSELFSQFRDSDKVAKRSRTPFITEPSTKLKTNMKISLVNKVSNFAALKWGNRRDLSLFGSTGSNFSKLKRVGGEKQSVSTSLFGLYQQNFWEQKSFSSVQNKLPYSSVFEFRRFQNSFDNLNIRFKNLASSFVIWRNKFQIRRDYLLLSYIYLDYLGTLINSFTNSSNFFFERDPQDLFGKEKQSFSFLIKVGRKAKLTATKSLSEPEKGIKLVELQDYKSGTLSSHFDIKSNYFVQSENYKTNLIKPFWSFSIINHLKNNHISVYEQLFNSFDPSKKYTEAFLMPKPELSTSIPNFGVLPKKSMSSFIYFSNRTSSVFFDRSIAVSPLRLTLAKNEPRQELTKSILDKRDFLSFPDSTTLNKNYLDYKTKLLNQKIILLKRQKLIASFSVGLKPVKFRIKQNIGGESITEDLRAPVRKETKRSLVSLQVPFSLLSAQSNVNQKVQWAKLKYRRKPGIYKSRIVCKETKIYMGTLFQNLGIHLVGATEQFATKGSVQNLTFWLCTVVFHLCLLTSLITNYKVSIHFCLKTLYSSLFILNKYFVYAKYRIQRLISYIYRNNLENVLETMHTGIFSLKTQSFLIVQKLNFSFKSFQQDLFQLSQLSLNNNSFNKLFFLPYSYVSSRENFLFSPYLVFDRNRRDDLQPQVPSLTRASLFFFKNEFKSKILMLVQYVQSKYQTPFSNLKLDSKQLDKFEKKKSRILFLDKLLGETKGVYKSKVYLTDLQVGKVAPSLNGPSFLSYKFAVQDVHLNKDKFELGSLVNLQKNQQLEKQGNIAESTSKQTTISPARLAVSELSTIKRSRSEGTDSKSFNDFFGRFLNNKSLPFIGSEPEKNIKLYFKVLKWNMLLTLLIGESEVLSELEPYREMHWYFLKKFPIFLRTSSTKDYLNMSEYQADEKIRIIKQKIRQTIMILYLRTRKYESKLQNRVTQNEKPTNYLVRNRTTALRKDETNEVPVKKSEAFLFVEKGLQDEKIFGEKKSDGLNISNIWKKSGFSFQFRRRKIKKLSFWKSLLTFLGRYSFLSRSVTLSKRFRESVMMFSYPLVAFGPIGTIFLTYGLKKFILDFDGEKEALRTSFKNDYQKTQPNSENSLFSSFLRGNGPQSIKSTSLSSSLAFPTSKVGRSGVVDSFQGAALKNDPSLPDRYINYIFKKMTNSDLEKPPKFSAFQQRAGESQTEELQNGKEKGLSIKKKTGEIEFDLEFFTDVQKFVKKYNRVYFSLTKTLNKTYQTKKTCLNLSSKDNKILMKLFMQNNIANKFDKSSPTFQTLKLNDFYDWSYSEKLNQLGKNSICSDTFDPKLRYYRFSTNFSKVLSDIGGFYTNIAAQQELGPIICKVYTGWERRVGKEDPVKKSSAFRPTLTGVKVEENFSNFSVGKQSAKNYLLVSGSTNPEAVLLLIQALSAEMGMKLFMEDAKRLQRIGRRGINKATKRLEKLFDIAQANSPALVFIEDIHVIGAKTKMLKVDEEQDDVEILSRSLLSKLIYRKYHKNKSLRESFIDQNLFTGGSSSTRRRSLKPTNPIPTSLVLYQLTRRKSLSNFFKSQENPSRRLNNKLFLSKKLSPAFTTNAVLIWKLFKSKIATPNKRIKEAPWYHIPVDAMRSINPLTYSIRVKVAKITLLAIFTMGTRLRLVKDLIRLFEKIQFESYQNFIVFATTNKLSTLDPNLRRPGRLEETISLEGLTGSASSSRSPAFMTILDTFKVYLKNVPGFSKTFNVIDNTLFSTSLNFQEWTVINYLAENAYYSLDSFNHNSGVTNFTPMDKLFLTGAVRSSNKWVGSRKEKLFFTGWERERTASFLSSLIKVKRGFEKAALRQLDDNRLFNIKNQNQRMTSFAPKNKINSPFSLFSFESTSSNSTASYWQSLFSNIIVQRKTGLFTFNKTFGKDNLRWGSGIKSLFYPSQLANSPDKRIQSLSRDLYKSSDRKDGVLSLSKFNLFLIFAYSRSGQSLISFLVQNSSNFGLRTNRNELFASEFQSQVEKNKLLSVTAPSLMFDSDYLMNLQLWPEILNILSVKKSNILATRRQNLHVSFLRFFGSKVGEIIFLNSVIWTTPTKSEILNQNRFIMYSNSGLHNIYNTTSSWSGAYASIKNVVTTSALYSKTPLLGKLLRLEDVSKPRQKQFFESLNAGMLFEYSDFHYRAFFKKNNISTEENLNLLINQKYMLNNQGRPLRKYVKLEHSNRLWLFRILYTELGSLDNITLNPTSMNYYYRNKIALKQVFKLASYQWWNWHLRKPVEQLEDIQEIAYFPCENKYYTPRRRRWVLTNGFWGYWFSFDKNFYFDLYEQYMLQTLHFACLQLDKNREVLDYLAKLYIYKEKLSEIDIIFALKRYQI